MNDLPYMRHYVRDVAALTSGLNAEEFGAFIALRDALWYAGGTLPFASPRICRLARVKAARWSRIWDAISHLFQVEEGVLSSPAMSEELASARKDMDSKRSRIAAARARKASAATDIKPDISVDIKPDIKADIKPEDAQTSGLHSQAYSYSHSLSHSLSDPDPQILDPIPNIGAKPSAPQASLTLASPDAPKRKPLKDLAFEAALSGCAKAWEGKYGVRYRPTPRDRGQFRALWAVLDEAERGEVGERFARYLADDSRWNVEEVRHGIWHFASNGTWNKYAVSAVVTKSERERREDAISAAWLASGDTLRLEGKS